ncbi:MAG TPA: long-chain fatty acid--CoA ligase, partial [Saprospiraceae bacterium]|nr:long-chain fatty acid--CoA ligase [Saprospiraceae bacterium]
MSDKRLFDFLYEQLHEHPQERAFGHKVGNQWQYYSTRQLVDLVNRASVGLLRLGLKPGDKVASAVYKTIPDWLVLDFALMQIGVLHVPMYPTISAREYEFILNESGAKYCVVGEGDLYDKMQKARANARALQEVFTFYNHPDARPWSAVLAEPGSDLTEVERLKAAVKPEDIMTLIYTSGTTGNPKGVMLTHRNIVFNAESIRSIVPVVPGDRVLSFLPVSHVFERVAVYFYTLCGCSVSFTGTDNLGGEDGDLKAVRPHFFPTVPRLLEKVYEKIYNKGLTLSGAKRWIFFWALDMTEHWDFGKSYTGWQGIKWALADKLIFSKWREALGGSVKGILTGASACPVKIMRTFNAAGIPVREAYGLTEAAPGISLNRYVPEQAMLGSVGIVLEGVTVHIEAGADYKPGEGEILVKGPNIMQGYYQQPDKTAEMIRYMDGERWLATGDIGTLVKGPGGHQYLKITDRKKELLKTSGGKYIAPTPIETMLKEHRLVDQAMVVGENLKFVSALIVPSEEGLKEWCHKHEVPWTSLSEAVKNPQVQKRYEMLAERINPNFGHFEQIKKVALLAQPWEATKTDGSEAELTPTMKLKRRVILQKFKS